MTKVHSLALVALVSAATVAFAQAPAPAPATPPKADAPPAGGAPPPAGPPKPAQEFVDFMKGFEGSWKCDTKWAAGSMGPGSPEMNVKSTVKFKKELDGHFYRGDYEVKKQKGAPMAMKGTFYIGYDPGSKQILVNAMDSMGGAAFGTGKIEGDKMVYTSEGYGMGQKMKIREEMGKSGPKAGYHKMEMDMGKGFVPFAEDNCKR